MNSHSPRSEADSVDRLAVTKRLQSEGRFEAASVFRESLRRKLRSAGVARKEALERAWQETVGRFPPLRPWELELRPVIALIALGNRPPNSTDSTFARVWRVGWLAVAKLYSEAAESRRSQAYVAMELKRATTQIRQKQLAAVIEADSVGYLVQKFAPECRKAAEAIGDEDSAASTLLAISQIVQQLSEAKTQRQTIRLIAG